MRWPLHSVRSSAEIDAIERRAIIGARGGDEEKAWKELAALLRAQASQREGALRLTKIVDQCCLSIDRALQVLVAKVAARLEEVDANNALARLRAKPDETTEWNLARTS